MAQHAVIKNMMNRERERDNNAFMSALAEVGVTPQMIVEYTKDRELNLPLDYKTGRSSPVKDLFLEIITDAEKKGHDISTLQQLINS